MTDKRPHDDTPVNLDTFFEGGSVTVETHDSSTDDPALGDGTAATDEAGVRAMAGDGDADEPSTGDPAATADEDPAPRRHRALLDWVLVIGIALLMAFVVRTFVLAHFVVDGTSMTSTLHHHDRVFVNKLSYRLHDPNRGDVVVLHELDGASERDLIKRVIALPGETIEMRNCEVLIDGRRLDEPYLDPEVVTPGNCGGDLAPTPVPEDHVFVMGDNRGGSLDSRAIGPVDEDELVGRAFVVFWPRSDWQWL